MNFWPYPCSLHTNIIKNNRKTILNREPNNVQHLKSLLPLKIIIFCYFILNSNKFPWLTITLQPLSYQFTSNMTPRLPLQASQPSPKIYNATAVHYSHVPSHKKTSNTPSTSTPNKRSHSVLYFFLISAFRSYFIFLNFQAHFSLRNSTLDSRNYS